MFNGIAEAPEEVDPEKRRQNLRNYLFDLESHGDELGLLCSHSCRESKEASICNGKEEEGAQGNKLKRTTMQVFSKERRELLQESQTRLFSLFFSISKLKQIYSKKKTRNE